MVSPTNLLPTPHQEYRNLRPQVGLPCHLAMTSKEVTPLHYQGFHLGQGLEILYGEDVNVRGLVPLVGKQRGSRGAGR